MFGAGRSVGAGYLIALRRQSKNNTNSRNNSKEWNQQQLNTQVRFFNNFISSQTTVFADLQFLLTVRTSDISFVNVVNW